MTDKELFSPVLSEGEEIIKSYRPNKARAYFTQILSWLLLALIFVPCFIGLALEEGSDQVDTITLIIELVIYVAIALFSFLLTHLWCKKTVYAVTNKRILIRTGRIGVDYKSLDFNMLGAVTVNVTWVDKLLHKNTGVVAFGSMSSPLVNSGAAKFSFNYIKEPYVIYKEVKAIIDSSKTENK